MNAAQRRERILTRLNSAGAPLSASTLAAELGVSRQIVVGDVALLRAAAGQLHLRTIREDALAEGYVSFVGAVQAYDAGTGVPFAAFAKARVYGDLRTLFRRQRRLWERETLPAVYLNGKLAAVWRLGADDAFRYRGSGPVRFIHILKTNGGEGI